MSENNMSIWSQVEQTDPAATKAATVSGQKITSISGQHMIKRATEMFGPVGKGWGWSVLEERFDQGGPIFADGKDANGQATREIIGHEIGHTVRIRLWYMQDGARHELEQYGCTPFAYKSKWGITTDTEAPKKSLTDAIKKSLAMLGFSADIFLGLFDDPHYLAERKQEADLQRAAEQEEDQEREKAARLEWLKSAVDQIEGAASLRDAQALHAKFIREATRRQEAAFIRRLATAFDAAKQKMEAAA